MLPFRPVIPTHALKRFFRAVDFPADVERIQIDGDRVVEERKRGQRPEKPAPRALRSAFEDDEIVKVSVGEEPEVPSCLNALVPAVLVDGFLRLELADGIVVLALEVGGIEERREIPEQILGGHRRDPAAVRLEERGDDSPMLVESFIELVQNAPVVIGKKLLVRGGWGIRRDPLREKENELFPAKLAGLHRLPVAGEPFVPRHRRPGTWVAPFLGGRVVGEQFLAVVGVRGPAELRAGGFLQRVKELADALVKSVEGAFAPVPQVRDFENESLGNKPAPVQFIPDEQVVRNPTVRRFHGPAGGAAGGAAAATPAH